MYRRRRDRRLGLRLRRRRRGTWGRLRARLRRRGLGLRRRSRGRFRLWFRRGYRFRWRFRRRGVVRHRFGRRRFNRRRDLQRRRLRRRFDDRNLGHRRTWRGKRQFDRYSVIFGRLALWNDEPERRKTDMDKQRRQQPPGPGTCVGRSIGQCNRPTDRSHRTLGNQSRNRALRPNPAAARAPSSSRADFRAGYANSVPRYRRPSAPPKG